MSFFMFHFVRSLSEKSFCECYYSATVTPGYRVEFSHPLGAHVGKFVLCCVELPAVISRYLWLIVAGVHVGCRHVRSVECCSCILLVPQL